MKKESSSQQLIVTLQILNFCTQAFHKNLIFLFKVTNVLNGTCSIKERIHIEETNSYRQNPDTIISFEPITLSYEYLYPSNNPDERNLL